MPILPRLLAILMIALAAPATAAEEVAVAPVPDWVVPVDVPPGDPELGAAPAELLLANSQIYRGADGGNHLYFEQALALRHPQALGSGNVALSWKPELADLVVHKVHVLRDGRRIDLLAEGQSFTVLRREEQLENAQLDGVLTATLQPQGLVAGDTVVVAYSMIQKPYLLPVKGENLIITPPAMRITKLFVRELWAPGRTLRWTTGPAFGEPVVGKAAGGTELRIERSRIAVPPAPGGIPIRYHMPAGLQVSEYRDWSEVSALFAASYRTASTLGPESPLRAEAAKIAAAHATPDARALAALRLVQDQVRYLSVALGEAGLVPEPADASWAKRYGDCKAKTVLLLALLRELGIEAEPVLVHSRLGALLPARLPMIAAFDHVIVRASVAGRDLWLDGTRAGDRDTKELTGAAFAWGLPVRGADATLVEIPYPPRVNPMTATEIVYDASAGFGDAVPVTGTVTLSGDAAMAMHFLKNGGNAAAFEESARGYLPGLDGKDPLDVGGTWDDLQGTFTITFKGKTRMDWNSGAGARRSFAFSNETIRWTPNFDRDAALGHADAPFLLNYPLYITARETIKLPRGGAGFDVVATDLDRSAGGARMTRTVRLDGDQASAVSAFRYIQPELPVDEAKAAIPLLKTVAADRALIRAPLDYREAARATGSRAPVTAEEYFERGYQRFESGRAKLAKEDFVKTAELAPNWAAPLAALALLDVAANQIAAAKEKIARAAEMEGDSAMLHQANGVIHMAEGKPVLAIAALTRALEDSPDNGLALLSRGRAFASIGEYPDAVADLEALHSIAPGDLQANIALAYVAAATGEPDRAMAALDAAEAANSGFPLVFATRPLLLQHLGKDGEAAAAYGRLHEALAASEWGEMDEGTVLLALAGAGRHKEAIARIDKRLARYPGLPSALGLRCKVRVMAGVDLAKAVEDCDKSIRDDPEEPSIAMARGHAKMLLDRAGDAIADFSLVLEWEPHHVGALYARGLAKEAAGDADGGKADKTAAIRRDFSAQFTAKALMPLP